MHLIGASIAENVEYQGGYRCLSLLVADGRFRPRPGQFVHVRVPGLESSALRRPFSVFDFEDGTLRILYKAVGRGTAILADLATGEPLDLMGPLGNGFPDAPRHGRLPVLIAGGYGVAPLHYLAKSLSGSGWLLVGGRTATDILCVDRFQSMGWQVACATEDGSLGDRGMVTDLLDRPAWRSAMETQAEEWFACGPDAMLAAVGDRAEACGVTAWLSLDKRMGCAVGACLACVQALRDANGGITIGRVCRDGPVFEARRIVWGRP